MTINKPVYVTKPALPPFEEFTQILKTIWENRILTNNGPYHEEFEKELSKYLGNEFISLFTNATLALLTALQVLRIKGEVITTPFSFVATTHALWWNKIKPVFVDIEPETFTLDPSKIEAAITPETTAILPVHVYGFPCKFEEIQKIADTYGLKVIYDAAHAFGSEIENKSFCCFGDLSVLSFHATKGFNTFEGGAIVAHDKKTKKRIDFLKNFGFADEVTVVEQGINAKMTEFQAALGLIQLKHYEEYRTKRKNIADLYRNLLNEVRGIRVLSDLNNVKHSYPYFPVLIKEEYVKSRDSLYNELKKYNIYSRRYFYPLISQFPSYRGLASARADNLPVAEKIAEEVLCLPIYPDLEVETVEYICKVIKDYA